MLLNLMLIVQTNKTDEVIYRLPTEENLPPIISIVLVLGL